MLSNNFFIFTRIDGLEVPSFEIGSITTKPVLKRATRVIKHISIDGRSGTLTEDTGSYNNIELKFQLINFKNNILEKEVLELLDGTGGELRISWLQGNFKVKEVSELLITEEIEGVFKIDLSFICEPFRYLESEWLELTKNNSIVNISGNYEADHITTVYGNGDISLLINDEQIVFKGVSDYITIDTARMICYKDNTPANNKMIGEFLKLKAFVNTIDWIGTVSKVEIKYRGRYLN